MARSVFALSLVVAFLVVAPISAIQVEILRSVGGLPPHLVGTFESPVNFLQAASGAYYIFDRRGQAVFTVDSARTRAQKIIEIGGEEGRIIQPSGFDVSRDGRIVVADVPRLQQRIQTFDPQGTRVTGFFLPGQPAARVTIDNLMLNGAGSIHPGACTVIDPTRAAGVGGASLPSGSSSSPNVADFATTGVTCTVIAGRSAARAE